MSFIGRILLLLLFSSSTIFAQSDLLKGKLIDALTAEPVAFATVSIKGSELGVVSNSDGSFRVPERFKAYSDTLEISCMGFETRKILISTLSVDKVRRLYLTPAVFELDETIVHGKKKRRLSARQIVRRAIKNIPNNYPRNSSSTIGYYRDYQMKDSKYVNLNEAILEVFDQGFTSIDSTTTEVHIYDLKKNFDFERDSLADDPYDYKRLQKIVDNAFLHHYGGNEFSILRVHDAIRNYNVESYSFVDRLDLDLLRNHSFRRDNSTYINGEAVYTIKFRKTYPNYRAYGELYISHRDFAIHKMVYTLYDERKHRPDGTFNRHKGRGRLLFEVVSEYRRKYTKMYLNYISFHNSFIVWEPPKFKVDSITVDLPRQCFVVKYNRMPRENEASNIDNYQVRFDRKRLKLRASVVFENSVFLFPDMTQKEKQLMIETLLENEKNGVGSNAILSVNVKSIRDEEGNMIHEWRKRDYNQFREYFVQHVKPNTDLPEDSGFMNKRKPIFENQPIARPENFDDYWMNTPLQTTGGIIQGQ